jgi:predicted DNA-binding transcriptional regulator AlpA
MVEEEKERQMQQTILNDPLVSTQELERMTGIKRRTYERWRLLGQGGPQFIHVGGGKLVRYRVSAIEAWLQRGGNPDALQKAA